MKGRYISDRKGHSYTYWNWILAITHGMWLDMRGDKWSGSMDEKSAEVVEAIDLMTNLTSSSASY